MFSLQKTIKRGNIVESNSTNGCIKRKVGFYYTKEHMFGDIWINWYFKETSHRVNGPATILYYDGLVITEKWYIMGKRSRKDDGPADVHYCNKHKFIETWFLNGKQYRVGQHKPTKIIYKLVIFSSFNHISSSFMDLRSGGINSRSLVSDSFKSSSIFLSMASI